MTLPDGKPETLGLTVLDEPRAKQSDPTVLDLQLRTVAKQTTVKPMVRWRCTRYTSLAGPPLTTVLPMNLLFCVHTDGA